MRVTCAGIDLGPLTLTCFSLIVAAAIVVSCIVTAWVARRRGEDPIIVFDLLGWMLFLSVTIGRLFYVLNPPPSVAALYSREWYLVHPLDMQIGPLAVWSGGMSMAGMLVGAVFGALIVIKRQGLDGYLWADIAVPGVLALLMIGPWGNLLSGQMIGPPADLPWGVAVDYPPFPYSDVSLYPDGTLFHPTPAYLSLWTLVVGATAWALNKRYGPRLQMGDTFFMVSLLYSVGLFLADLLRVDVTRVILGLSEMQVVALVMIIGAAAMLMRRHRYRLGLRAG